MADYERRKIDETRVVCVALFCTPLRLEFVLPLRKSYTISNNTILARDQPVADVFHVAQSLRGVSQLRIIVSQVRTFAATDKDRLTVRVVCDVPHCLRINSL